MKVGELCAGYGGISLGLRLAGEEVDPRWLAESDPALDVLHPTGIPNLGDITTVDWTAVEPVDLLTAGFPCQPVSAAGAQLAEADPRWLWPQVRRAVAALRPDRVLLENVRNLIGMRKGEIWRYILADLTALGYDVTWLTLGACAVGAAHHRHRVFALATYSPYTGLSVPVRLDVQECGARRGSVMVPTATMTDHKDSRNETSGRQPGSAHHGGTTLGDFAVIVGAMLPSPGAADASGGRRVPLATITDSGRIMRPSGETYAMPLASVAQLLPSPSASSYGSNQGGAAGRVGPSSPGSVVPARLDLLPSPQSRDGQGRGTPSVDTAEQRFASGRRNLDDGLALLPSRAFGDGSSRGVLTQGNRKSSDLGPSVQPEHWGRFAAAVQRHAATFGPPPAATEPNRNGAPRLAPAFAEWLMCIPVGHVTDALPRSQALKAIGNGVCPPQLAQAWRYLTGLDRPSDTSIGSHVMTSSTTTTSQDVKAIQDRQSNGRGAVIDAAMMADRAFAERNHEDQFSVGLAVEAAMMALVEHWRAEADIWEASKKRGSVGTAKELRQCASRLAGFAVGLTSRPVTTPNQGAYDIVAVTDTVVDDAGTLTNEALEASEACPHPAYALSLRKDGTTLCTLCQAVWAMDVVSLMAGGQILEALSVAGSEDVVAALPVGDPVAAVLGGAMTAENPEQLMAFMRGETDDPGVVHAVRGGIQFPTAPNSMNVHISEIGSPLIESKTEEDNLRDIIGPLGASATALVDNPFTRPNVPWLNRPAVAVVAYEQLPVIAAATGTRDYVSHSYVEGYESCSLAAMLKDASRAGHIGASRPGWSQIAGKAFHAAVEAVERAALAGISFFAIDATFSDIEAFWMSHFDTEIKEQLAALVGTPYADSGTWYVSNRGKEGFDWWRVEGARMLKLYLNYHTPAWRAANQTFLLQDKTPVIELEYDMTIRSLDQERGLRAKGFIDKATLNMETYSLTVLDYKTGARDPDSTFQLGEYGHALLMAMGIAAEPPDRPILGSYWLARKGIYTTPTAVLARHPMSELQYRYDQAARGNKAGIFAPHVSNFCTSCSVKDYCPTQAGRS